MSLKKLMYLFITSQTEKGNRFGSEAYISNSTAWTPVTIRGPKNTFTLWKVGIYKNRIPLPTISEKWRESIFLLENLLYEFQSLTFFANLFNGLLLFHHVTYASGLEPVVLHSTSYLLSADTCIFLFSIFTVIGFTVDKISGLVSKGLIRNNFMT